MREAHQIGIAGRRIDDDKFVAMLDLGDRLGERAEFDGFVIAYIIGIATLQGVMKGSRLPTARCVPRSGDFPEIA